MAQHPTIWKSSRISKGDFAILWGKEFFPLPALPTVGEPTGKPDLLYFSRKYFYFRKLSLAEVEIYENTVALTAIEMKAMHTYTHTDIHIYLCANSRKGANN